MNELNQLNEIIDHLEKSQEELTKAVGKFQRGYFPLPIIYWDKYQKLVKMSMRQNDFIKTLKKSAKIMEKRSGNKTN